MLFWALIVPLTAIEVEVLSGTVSKAGSVVRAQRSSETPRSESVGLEAEVSSTGEALPLGAPLVRQASAGCATLVNAAEAEVYGPELQAQDKAACEAEGCVYTINDCLPDAKQPWQMKSLIYDWKKPLSKYESGECTCGPHDSCQELDVGDLTLNFAEMCLEIGIPIFPGVQVLVGLFGGMEYTGTMNSGGYKSMSVSLSGAIVLRVMPVSVHFTLGGTLQIESHRSDNFHDLIKYSLGSLVQSKLRSEFDNIEEQVDQMHERLQQLDPSYSVNHNAVKQLEEKLRNLATELAGLEAAAAEMPREDLELELEVLKGDEADDEGLTQEGKRQRREVSDEALRTEYVALAKRQNQEAQQSLQAKLEEAQLANAAWPIAMAERVAVLRESLGLGLKREFGARAQRMSDMLEWFVAHGFTDQGDVVAQQMWRQDEVQKRVVARMIKLQGEFTAAGERRKDTTWHKLWKQHNGFWKKQWGQQRMPRTANTRLRLIMNSLAWYRVLEITKVAQLVQMHVAQTLFGDASKSGEDCLEFEATSTVPLHACLGEDGTPDPDDEECYRQYLLAEDYADAERRIFASGGEGEQTAPGMSTLTALTHGRLLCALMQGQEPGHAGAESSYASTGLEEIAEYFWPLPDGTSSKIPYQVVMALPVFFRAMYEHQQQALRDLEVTASRVYQNTDETLYLPRILEQLQALGVVNEWYKTMEGENPYYTHWSTREMLPVEVFADAHCRPHLALEVAQHLAPADLIDCAENGLQGWLLDFHKQEEVREQIQQSITMRMLQLETAGRPIALTWMFEGQMALSVHVGISDSFSLCSPDTSTLQVKTSHALVRKIVAYDHKINTVAKASITTVEAALFPFDFMGYRFTQAWHTEHREMSNAANIDEATQSVELNQFGGADLAADLPGRETATKHFTLRMSPSGQTHLLQIYLMSLTGLGAQIVTVAHQLANPLLQAIKGLMSPPDGEAAQSGAEKFKGLVQRAFRGFKGLVLGVNPLTGAALLAEMIVKIAANPFYSSKLRLDLRIKTPKGQAPSFDASLKLINRVKVDNNAGGWLGSLIPTGTFLFSNGLTLDMTGMMLMHGCKNFGELTAEKMFKNLDPKVRAELQDVGSENATAPFTVANAELHAPEGHAQLKRNQPIATAEQLRTLETASGAPIGEASVAHAGPGASLDAAYEPLVHATWGHFHEDMAEKAEYEPWSKAWEEDLSEEELGALRRELEDTMRVERMPPVEKRSRGGPVEDPLSDSELE